MLTFVLGAIGVFVVIGLVLLAMRSGQRGGRNNQSGRSVANQQLENKEVRGSVRTSGRAND
jgi:hypothetical protein